MAETQNCSWKIVSRLLLYAACFQCVLSSVRANALSAMLVLIQQNPDSYWLVVLHVVKKDWAEFPNPVLFGSSYKKKPHHTGLLVRVRIACAFLQKKQSNTSDRKAPSVNLVHTFNSDCVLTSGWRRFIEQVSVRKQQEMGSFCVAVRTTNTVTKLSNAPQTSKYLLHWVWSHAIRIKLSTKVFQ